MAMQNTPPRTSLRDGAGPRAVDSGSHSIRRRASTRRSSKGDEADKHRPRRRDSHHSSPRKDSHRRKVSSPSNSEQAPTPRVEQPALDLTVVGQPARGVALGTPVAASVVLSLRTTTDASSPVHPDRIDTSRLFAITTLTADDAPCEAGTLTGPQLYDSLREMPADSARAFERLHPGSLVLGYFAFPGLVIRQAGTFRVRTTLARMGAEGAASLCVVDSEAVKVERRVGAGEVGRRAGRICG